MAENRSCAGDGANGLLCRDSVCIDCRRVLDSCRDKDCFEDVRVFLTEYGQEVVEKAGSIRVKSAKVVWTALHVEPVQFNRGFFQIYVRFYVKVVCEVCVCPGKSQDIEGIAVCEKKVILYGSEGSVSIYRSDPINASFCQPYDEHYSNNLPIAVCEVVDPVSLGVKLMCDPKPCCCCCAADIPERICGCVNGSLSDTYDDSKKLYVTLGFFSVIRIERPGQYLINAVEYSVPDKECVEAEENDPCALFRRMSFPVNEFSPPTYKQLAATECCENTRCDKKRCQ